MPIKNIRLSCKARDQLIRLKSITGIKYWHVLCRWGFCVSLAEPNPPPTGKIPADSSVEMDWSTFGGENADIYWAILKQRCKQDGLGTSEETLEQQFRAHLHRGIGYLLGDRGLRSIADLVGKAITEQG
jgi:DNA sulfur modification protein DndE